MSVHLIADAVCCSEERPDDGLLSRSDGWSCGNVETHRWKSAVGPVIHPGLLTLLLRGVVARKMLNLSISLNLKWSDHSSGGPGPPDPPPPSQIPVPMQPACRFLLPSRSLSWIQAPLAVSAASLNVACDAPPL